MASSITLSMEPEVSGSITLTMRSAVPLNLKTRQPRVLFFNKSEEFDPEQCWSEKEFTVNPNEEHVLLIASLPKIHIMWLDEDKQLKSNNILQSGHFLGYSICMKQQDMTVTVGKNTKLSLLLNSDHFYVVPFFMDQENFIKLYNKKSIADTTAADPAPK